jgi:hypothetical protein
MKKLFPWIIILAIAGVFFGWILVIHSDSYKAGVTWIRSSPKVSDDVGIIKHIYPDISRYRVGSSNALSQAHFSVYVYGSKGTDRVELFVQQNEENGWHVVRAVSNGRELVVE